MSMTVKTLILILVSITFVYLISSFVPFLLRLLLKQVSKYIYHSSDRRKSLKSDFLSEEDNPGKFFAKMLYTGLYKTIKTINHGLKFPDNQQRDTFIKYGTSSIKDALDKIGESL